MTIPKTGITADKKTPDKIQYIIDNYLLLTRQQIANNLNETLRWVKRQLNSLHSSNRLPYKCPPPETFLSEADWTEEIKSYVFELRCKYLKPNHYIVKKLKEKFNFNVKSGALQFWLGAFNYNSRSKQDWMNEYLTKEIIEDLLNKSYRIIDISNYVKKEFGVYVSDDLILTHIQKLNLLSYKLKRLKDIKEKSEEFSKEWLSKKIDEHSAIKGISEEMGFSKTIVMKRIKEEGLSLIKHRKVWSKDMEILRNMLFEALPLDISQEHFHQMVLGWLIGDGHLDLNGRLVINHSLYQTSYLYLKIRVLKKFITNVVTVPRNEMDKYYGGKEQLGISCPGFDAYIKYLNEDGSKNYDKIISELDSLGWACYFMDDGSFWNDETVMAINDRYSKLFEYKYKFGRKVMTGLLEVKDIDPMYIIPNFYYKLKRYDTGAYWKDKIPELFKPEIDNDLDLCFVNGYTIYHDPLLLNKAVDYYHKRGFPFFSISDDYLNKEFKKFKALKTEYFWRDEKSLKHISAGNHIFKNFMPHMIEAKYKGVSPLETFNSYSLFYKVLEYSLNTDKSILPNFIYNNLIHFNGGVVGFPCSVAKVIVEKFSPEDGVVVDPCAGWGGRLIGASVLNRSYIGFEPWDKTARGLNNIINFFEIKKAVIFNTEFNIEKAPEQCSLVFTSPPYIDLEVYGKPMKIEDWKNLMSSIIKYAEESLVLGGYLVLNIPRFLKNLLPETFLKEEESIYWFTSSRKKNLDKAEILYIWSRQ
jgi:hypothetical protein